MTPTRFVIQHYKGRPGATELVRQTVAMVEGFDWRYHLDTRNSAILTTWEILTYHHAYHKDSDLVILEDDVIGCLNAVQAISNLEVPPDLEFLSFFSPSAHRNNRRTGLMRLPISNKFSWAQALKFPSRTVAKLAANPPDLTKPIYQGIHTHSRDWAIGEALQGGQYGLVCPSWVQHIGMVSGLPFKNVSRTRPQCPWFHETNDALKWSPTPIEVPHPPIKKSKLRPIHILSKRQRRELMKKGIAK